jgi:hypothetical protein
MVANFAAPPMPSPLRHLIVLLAVGLLGFAAPVLAQKADAPPKPETYLCPHATGGAVDCFLHAVEHLYTMCRQVKSIEIIEFGYEKSDEGVNGAKSEYCVDKQRQNIVRPYQAALKEATPWQDVIENLRALQQYWLDSMANLKWQNGEPPDAYEDRIVRAYDELSFKIDSVRVAFSTAPAATGTAVAAKAGSKPGAKTSAKPATTAKAN